MHELLLQMTRALRHRRRAQSASPTAIARGLNPPILIQEAVTAQRMQSRQAMRMRQANRQANQASVRARQLARSVLGPPSMQWTSTKQTVCEQLIRCATASP